MMKSVFVLALAIAAASATFVLVKETPYEEVEMKSLFHEFKKSFNKEYTSTTEELHRYEIFKGYVEFVRAHNVREAAGEETFKTAINHLCDLTREEYRKFYLGQFNRTRSTNVEILPRVAKLTGSNGGVDWRTKGAVTPVKNQGQCGSCWSFSTTGSVEGAHQIATGQLVSLSEQQLCDCSTSYGNHGCEGGLMDYAFKYIEANQGLDTEADYSYVARDESCDKSKEAQHAATINGFKDVQQGSEDQLKSAVTQQPVSIAIEADQQSFQTYHSGIFTGPCGQNLDHGVLAVGYGDSPQDYWIVKNSWGAGWGDNGYIMIAMGQNLCGISNAASYPTAKSGPAPPPPPPGPPSPPPSPSGGPYEDPKPNGCASGEQAIKINGISGDYCAPSCSSSSPCPAAPAGCSAQGECVVETSGSSQPTLCALICQPGANAACPGTATCKPIQGVGVCTYDD